MLLLIMTIVYCDIVGDLFHYGHVKFFQKCLQYGDTLYVGLCADQLVASYKRIPILKLSERQQVIESCQYVDKVIPNCPCPITEDFINEHKIDVVVHANDMNEETLKKWYQVPIQKNMFVIVNYQNGISTTDIINRIKNRFN